MSWLSVVLWVVTNAPKLIALVKDFIDVINNKPKDQQELAKQELRDAVRTRDVGEVSKVLHKHCDGVACPADLVTEEN